MSCPLFVDFTRECIKEVEFTPTDTTEFCATEKYVDCPFYRLLIKKGDVCKNIGKCPAFKNFQVGDFNKFVEISNRFCTSKNHVSCKRYITKESGQPVPISLHPDGSFVKEWENKQS